MYPDYQRSSSGSAYAQPRGSSKHYGHCQKPSRNVCLVGSGPEGGSLFSPFCYSTFLAAVVAVAAVVKVQYHLPARILFN
jgi:hypothetical protein